jgi:GTPase SAR1 family protein
MSLYRKSKERSRALPEDDTEGDSSKDLLIACDDNSNYYFSEDSSKGSEELSNLNNVMPLPIIIKSQIVSVYVSAASGSGKSTICNHLCKNLLKMNKKIKNIFFFTVQNESDPAYKDLEKIKVKKEVENPYTKKMETYEEPIFLNMDINNTELYDLPTEYFKDSIIILDDYDTLEKDIEKLVQLFIRKFITIGRKLNINWFILKHKTLQTHKTSDIIFEARAAIIFPKLNLRESSMFLNKYMNMNSKEVAEIKKHNSRYLFIHKTIPNLLIMNDCIRMI